MRNINISSFSFAGMVISTGRDVVVNNIQVISTSTMSASPDSITLYIVTGI